MMLLERKDEIDEFNAALGGYDSMFNNALRIHKRKLKQEKFNDLNDLFAEKIYLEQFKCLPVRLMRSDTKKLKHCRDWF